MYTGRYMKKENPKHNRRAKSIVILVSTLALLIGLVGGTLAYLAAKTNDVVNTFSFGDVPIDIPEKFDGTTKTNVRVSNTGNVDAFVRAKVVVTWKNPATGEVSGTAVQPSDYTLDLNTTDWFQGTDGFYYCKDKVAAKGESAILITKATKKEGVVPPEGFDLSIEILAQSVQADGMKDGKPMVQAIGWPVTVNSNGQLQ